MEFALKSTDIKVAKVIGLQLSIVRKMATNISIEKLQRSLRRSIIAYAYSVGGQMDDKGNLPITLTMPCGNFITYPDVEDIPMEDVLCPCGDSTHWLVKYDDLQEDRN